MVLTNQLPSQILAKLEAGEDVFCKFGQLLQLKANVTRIKYTDFVELYVRSYGNQYFYTDLKGYPQSFDNFKELEFREKYAELYLYSVIDQIGTEAQFDAMLENSKLLGRDTQAYTVRLVADSNVVCNYYPTLGSSSHGKITTSQFQIDSVETNLNDYVLFANQTDKKQNGIWRVSVKNDLYAPGKTYTAGQIVYDQSGPTFYLALNNYTAVDLATDVLDLNLEDVSATPFAASTSYNTNDYVYFESNYNSYALYKCVTSHIATSVFDPSKFDTPVRLYPYDFLERSVLAGEIFSDCHITVTDGFTLDDTNYEIRIPITKSKLIYGGNQGDDIEVVGSSVVAADVSGIISDQNYIESLTARVKDLYKAKWFPPKWLEA